MFTFKAWTFLKNKNCKSPTKTFIKNKGSEKDYSLHTYFEYVSNCNELQTQRGQRTSTLGINHPSGISHLHTIHRSKNCLVSIRVETILHNELCINWYKQKKRWYLLYFLLQNKPPKTWIISKLMLQNCPFRILFQFHHSCRDLHPRLSYHTQKLSVQFLLKATVCCHFLVHLSVTILSTLVLCIHSLYPSL